MAGNNRPTGNEVILIQHNRNFIQYGSARPNNDAKYYGTDAAYTVIKGVTLPEHGTITPFWTGDPNRPGDYRLVARSKAAPALPTASLHMLENRGVLNRQLGKNCPFTVYVVSGDCKDPSDFLNGWSNYVQIYSNALVGAKNLGDRSDWGTDKPVEDVLPLTLTDIYPVGAVGFGAAGNTQVIDEVLDVAYGVNEQCGDCGPQNDGTKWQYAVQTYDGSNAASVLYSTDGGQTWATTAITGIGASEAPSAIDVVGDKLVVVSSGGNCYYYATINQATGVPGAFTKVTTGFVSSKQPQDILVYSTREIYFVGNGGYIYKSSDITAGVSVISAGGTSTSNLKRIAGFGNTLVAVGASATVLVSLNRGVSWAVAAAAPGAGTLQGVSVLDASRYWVCDNAGALYYTLNGGATWTAKTLGNSPTDLRDVVFVNDEVGWVVGATTDPTGLVFATWDGGRDWTQSGAAPRMNGVPTSNFQRANRIAVPNVSSNLTASNNALIGGLGASTDGILLVGAANLF